MNRAACIALASTCFSAGTAIAGPDLIIADMPAAVHWGSVNGVHAYSFSTIICNLGDAPVQFSANTNAHPVITQNLYRLSAGRFEQIGLGFGFHTFFALEQNFCATCARSAAGRSGPDVPTCTRQPSTALNTRSDRVPKSTP